MFLLSIDSHQVSVHGFDLGVEELLAVRPLGLEGRGEQVVVDGEQFGMQVQVLDLQENQSSVVNNGLSKLTGN